MAGGSTREEAVHCVTQQLVEAVAAVERSVMEHETRGVVNNDVSMQWNWGLDDFASNGRPVLINLAVQKATWLLSHWGAPPAQ